MNRTLGLQLYGPCSITGATVKPHDTVAIISETGRVQFREVKGVEKISHTGFDIEVKGGDIYSWCECYLLYTVEPA